MSWFCCAYWEALGVVEEFQLCQFLHSKEIKPVNPKGNQSWIFIGRTDAEAEAPILWLPEVKSQLTGKDLDAGQDWRKEEKGMTDDETVGWHHRLDGHEFEKLIIQELVMDRESWRAAVHGVTKIRHNWATQLNWNHHNFIGHHRQIEEYLHGPMPFVMLSGYMYMYTCLYIYIYICIYIYILVNTAHYKNDPWLVNCSGLEETINELSLLDGDALVLASLGSKTLITMLCRDPGCYAYEVVRRDILS